MARKLESGHGEYTADGSMDLNGKSVLRSKTGGWKACSFIVVYEVFERTAFFGISSNLILYLTNKLHQGTVEASNNVTNWVGTVFLTPLLGGYIADAYFGRYWTFLLSSFIYLMGMCLLTVAVSIPSLKPPPCQTSCPPASTLQLGVFFGALYILAIGNGGAKPNISTIGADQFDELHPRERMHKLSFFNWWTTSIFLGTLFANTVLVYLQDNVGWSIGYGIPTLGLLISIIIFLAGTPFYRHKMPQGSPFTRMARVILAAIRKWNLPIPADGRELYELNLEVYAKKRMLRIHSTNSMRFLNKAAVKGDSNTKWTLCPVTHVEETKGILRMLPVFVALFIPYIVVAQSNTLFIKQGTTLNRHIGPDFQIPPASLGAFITISMLASVILYDRYFVKIMRTWTNNPRGITILQRIGVALFIHIITLVVACLTERRRLNIARNLGLDKSGVQVPLTIFTLVPQFVLMGLSDSFLIAGVLEFFYDQAPESMKSLGTSISLSTYGVGNFLSSFVLTLVSDITSKEGKGWILNNLNASHLDYYYAFLAVLSFLNFNLFLFISYNYTYRVELSVSRSDAIRGDQEATNGDTEN